MGHEIELKLALTESAQRNFLRHPLLRQATGRQSFRLVNLYYDTPRLDLRERGIALRLRAKGRLWLQTVKCAGRAGGGLSARPEWETPYVGHFDFSAIDDRDVRAWLELPKLKPRIAPVFETNFQRTAWQFEPAPGTRIEMVLDRGWIAAAGRREAISEIELELQEGDVRHLFALARALAARIAVVPAPLSKADRGYRLFVQAAAAPVKAAPIPLSGDEEPAAAFNRIALACLDHLQRNHAGAIASDDPEYIHQMRVATRRLRAALRLFAPLLPPGFADPAVVPLRELMGVLGQARDLDVLLAEIAEPVLQALPDEPRLAALVGIITERRFDRRRAAIDFLRAPRFGALVLELLETLHDLTPPPKVGAGGTALNLAGFATDRLRRLRGKVLRLAARARIDDPPTLHALRIGIKRLRYALEFFAPLAAPKAMRRLLGQLAALQDMLGQINDLANAGELLMDCAGSDARLREAVTLIGGWHGPRHQELLAAIRRELKHLGKLRLPEFTA
jgi:adenylate cyclase